MDATCVCTAAQIGPTRDLAWKLFLGETEAIGRRALVSVAECVSLVSDLSLVSRVFNLGCRVVRKRGGKIV